MTRAETYRVLQLVVACWPHTPLTEAGKEVWVLMLADVELGEATAAVEAYFRDGREHAPNAGQVVSMIAELDNPQLEHGEAFSLAMRAASKFGADRQADALDWLTEQGSAATAEAARLFGWVEFCRYEGAAGTLRAQFRDVYLGVVSSGARARRYGLPEGRGPGKPRKLSEALGTLRQALPAPGGTTVSDQVQHRE